MSTVRELTQRQIQTLCLVAAGFTDKEIAAVLKIKQTTVYTHLIDIRMKLGAVNRTHAVYLACCFNLLPPRLIEGAGRPRQWRLDGDWKDNGHGR